MRGRKEIVPHTDYFNFSLLIYQRTEISKKHLKNFVRSQRRSNVTDILHHTSIRKHFCWTWLPKCNVFQEKKIFLEFLQECYEISFIFF